MSHNPKLVFKCTDPQKLHAYLAENDAKFQAFRADVKALGEKLGVTQFTMRRDGWGNAGGQHVTGYVEEDRKADPKPGFRRDAKTGYMLPALRTEHGKRWQARLHGTKYEPADIPGLPGMIFGIGYMGGFHLTVHGDGVFATLGFDVEDDRRELQEIDAVLWVPAKLSEFYAAKEESEVKA